MENNPVETNPTTTNPGDGIGGDPKYIRAVYDQLGGEKTFGTFEKYSTLISTDDKYIKAVYDSYGENTFGSYDKFYSLVKKKEQPESVAQSEPSLQNFGAGIKNPVATPQTTQTYEKKIKAPYVDPNTQELIIDPATPKQTALRSQIEYYRDVLLPKIDTPELQSEADNIREQIAKFTYALTKEFPEEAQKMYYNRIANDAKEWGDSYEKYANARYREYAAKNFMSEPAQKEYSLLKEIEQLKGTNLDPEYVHSVVQSKQAEIEQLREERRKEYQTKIDDFWDQFGDVYNKLNPQQQEVVRKQVKDWEFQRDNFFDPNKIAQKAYSENQGEVDNVAQEATRLGFLPKDATPQQKMAYYLDSLIAEYKELSDLTGVDQNYLTFMNYNTFRFGQGKSGVEYIKQRNGGESVDMSTIDPVDLMDRMYEIKNKIEAIAPIALLNRTPDNIVFGTQENPLAILGRELTGALPAVRGELQSQQQEARNIQEALALSGAGTETVSGDVGKKLEKAGADYENWTAHDIASMGGQSIALFLPFAIGAGEVRLATSGAKSIPALSKAITWLETGGGSKAAPIIKWLYEGTKSGLAYKGAGLTFQGIEDEGNFTSGFFGGLFGSATAKAFEKAGASKIISKIFGDKTPEVLRITGQLSGRGAEEMTEETAQQIVQIYQQTGGDQKAWEEIKRQFGDPGDAVHFFVSTFLMGAAMGAGHVMGDGNTKKLMDKTWEGMTPEEKKVAGAIIEEIKKEGEVVAAKEKELSQEPESVPMEVEKPVGDQEVISGKETLNDKEDISGLPSSEQEGKTVVEEKPVERGGVEEAGTSGVLQTQEEVKPKYEPDTELDAIFSEDIVAEPSKKNKVETNELSPKTKLEGNIAGHKYAASIENGKIKITNLEGKDVSPSTKKKYEDDAIRFVKFDTGTVTEIPPDINTESQAVDYIANNSNNPVEILSAIVSQPEFQDVGGSKESVIAQGVVKMRKDSVINALDKNIVNRTMALTYFAGKGDVSAPAIDQLAQTLSYEFNPDGDGTDITVQDIADFIRAYPGGERQWKKTFKNPSFEKLSDKFLALTGLKINPRLANKILDIELSKNGIEPSIEKEALKYYESKQYSTEAEAIIDAERQFAEAIRDGRIQINQPSIKERTSERGQEGKPGTPGLNVESKIIKPTDKEFVDIQKSLEGKIKSIRSKINKLKEEVSGSRDAFRTDQLLAETKRQRKLLSDAEKDLTEHIELYDKYKSAGKNQTQLFQTESERDTRIKDWIKSKDYSKQEVVERLTDKGFSKEQAESLYNEAKPEAKPKTETKESAKKPTTEKKPSTPKAEEPSTHKKRFEKQLRSAVKGNAKIGIKQVNAALKIAEAGAKQFAKITGQSEEDFYAGLSVESGAGGDLFQMTMPDGSKKNVRPINPEIVNGFYSPLEKAILDVSGEKMTGAKWLQQLKSEVESGQALFQKKQESGGNIKGSVEFTEDGRAIIRAMKSADISTLVHELGHVFRRSLYKAAELAKDPETKAQIERDIQATEEWAGVKDGNWTVQAEEKFARGFEKYLSDGEAPNKSLKNVFQRLREWLTDIYNGITGSEIDIDVSPQMQEVFDRILGREIPKPGKGERISRWGNRGAMQKATEVSDEVKKIGRENPHIYRATKLSEISEQALNEIVADGGFDTVYPSLLKEDLRESEKEMVQVKRQLAIMHYSKLMADAKIDGRTRNGLYERVKALEEVTTKAGTRSGKEGAVLAIIMRTAGPEGWIYYTSKRVSAQNGVIEDNIRKNGRGASLDKAREGAGEAVKNINKEVPKAGEDASESKKLKDRVRKATQRAKKVFVPKETLAKAKEELLSLKNKLMDIQSGGKGIAKLFQKSGKDILFQQEEDVRKVVHDIGGNIIQQGIVSFDQWSKQMAGILDEAGIESSTETLQKLWKDETFGESHFTNASKKFAESKTPKALREMEVRMQGLVKEHYTTKEDVKKRLSDKFSEDLGLDESDAKAMEQIVNDEVSKRIKKTAQKETTRLFGTSVLPNEQKAKRNAMNRLVEAANMGALTDDFAKGLVAMKFGLKPEMSSAEASELMRLVDVMQSTRPGSTLEAKAARDVVDYIIKLYPESWWKSAYETWTSLIYVNMLSSIATHATNIASSGTTMAVAPAQQMTNMAIWVKAIRMGLKDGSVQSLYDYNPMRLIGLTPLINGLKGGWVRAKDIVKSGSPTDSKYVELVAKKDGFMIPELEKKKHPGGQRFHPIFTIGGVSLNPYNSARYVGRALLAEDAFMHNIAFEYELKNILLDKMRDKGLRGKELTKAVQDEYNRRSVDMSAVNTQLENEIASYEAMSGKKLSNTDKQMLKRDIIMDHLLTSEERTLAESRAREYIFTGNRHGAMGRLAGLIGKASSNPVGGVALKPFVPFSKIVGNVFEYVADTIPVYGHLRAMGYSPTGLMARTNIIKDGQSAQLGTRGTREYELQMGRAWFGTVAFTALAMLLGGTDDDDWIQVTGGMGNHNTPKYTLRIGSFEINYSLIAPLYVPLAIIGSYNDYKKYNEDQKDEELRLDALDMYLRSVGRGIFSIKDFSFVEGVSDLTKIISDITVKKELDPSKADSKEEASWLRGLKAIGSQYTEYLSKGLPTNNAMVDNITKIFDATSYSKKDLKEFLAYSAGIEMFTNNPNVDIFGNHLESMTGQKNFPFLAPEKKDKELHEFLIDNGIYLNHPNNVPVRIGTDKRVLTSDEWYEYRTLAGEKFRESLKQYMQDGRGVRSGDKYLIQRDIDTPQGERGMDLWDRANKQALRELEKKWAPQAFRRNR